MSTSVTSKVGFLIGSIAVGIGAYGCVDARSPTDLGLNRGLQPRGASFAEAVWRGQGASGGICLVSSSATTKTWTFHLTTPDGATSTLTAAFQEGTVQVAATLVTNLAGANNDLTFTAKTAGVGGNSISVKYLAPGAASSPLSVTVLGNQIIIGLGSDAAGNLMITASQLRDAVSADPSASALVGVQLASGNDGTGIVSPMTETFLSGGGLGSATNTYTVAGTKLGGGRSPFEFLITTDAGAILLSASATNAAANSNLTVVGCN